MLITAWLAWCVCVSAIFVLHALDTYGARSVLDKGLGTCFPRSRKRYISLFFARDTRGVGSVLGEGLGIAQEIYLAGFRARDPQR